MKYNTDVITTVKIAPHIKVEVSIISHMAGCSRISSISLRKFFRAGRDTWLLTRSGFCMEPDTALALQNEICKLPEHIDLEGKDYLELWRTKKNETVDIVLGIGQYYGKYGLDVREYVTDVERGYKGFSIKGVRVPIEASDDLAQGLLDAVMKLREKKDGRRKAK